METCLVCGKETTPCLNFGEQPISDLFLRAGEPSGPTYNLRVNFCQDCNLAQLVKPPAPSLMFRTDYPFRTSTSENMARHFSELSRKLFDTYKVKSVLEIGSNDGTFLKFFSDAHIPHIGIDPAADACEEASNKGVHCWPVFFDHSTAARLKNEFDCFDLIFAANTICHIEKINDLFKNVFSLLSEDGIFVFEDPYLGDILDCGAFDQFYDEHVFYFTATSVSKIADRHGLQLIDIQSTKNHGGQLRYTLSKRKFATLPSVVTFLDQEASRGLNDASALIHFQAETEDKVRELKSLVESLANSGKRIVGYGATAKSSTVLSLADFSEGSLLAILDSTPHKQGRFSPHGSVKIISPKEAAALNPTHYLLFAWNHREEIFRKEKDFTKKGGSWIEYAPFVSVTTRDDVEKQ